MLRIKAGKFSAVGDEIAAELWYTYCHVNVSARIMPIGAARCNSTMYH